MLVVPLEQRRNFYERLGLKIQFEGNLIAPRFVGVCVLHEFVGTILPMLRVGLLDRSLRLYEVALALDPNDHRALCGLADARRFSGDWDGAPELFDRALELGEDDPLTQLDYAEYLHSLLVKEGEKPTGQDRARILASARKHFRRSIELGSNVPETHAQLGFTYFLRGEDKARAIPHLERAFDLLRSDGSITFLLGRAYAEVGDIDSARFMYGLTSARYHGGEAQQKVQEAIAKLGPLDDSDAASSQEEQHTEE